MKVAELAGRPGTPALTTCLAQLDPSAPADYRELAALLAVEWVAAPPKCVGLAGGQGAGKSTLGRLIEAAGSSVGLRIAVLSLDDFYSSRTRRRALATRVHPLFEIRGPPGTHDIEHCREVMQRLRRAGEIDVPIFDKGQDEPVGVRRLTGPFDLVVLEGWCVGAEPVADAALSDPINALEREDDVDARWRRHINAELAGRYAQAWRALDFLVYLRVPDLAAVRRWRLQQEQALPEALRRGPEAVDRFVQHYERITRSMWESLPERADLTVGLAQDHSIASMAFRSA